MNPVRSVAMTAAWTWSSKKDSSPLRRPVRPLLTMAMWSTDGNGAFRYGVARRVRLESCPPQERNALFDRTHVPIVSLRVWLIPWTSRRPPEQGPLSCDDPALRLGPPFIGPAREAAEVAARG